MKLLSETKRSAPTSPFVSFANPFTPMVLCSQDEHTAVVVCSDGLTKVVK